MQADRNRLQLCHAHYVMQVSKEKAAQAWSNFVILGFNPKYGAQLNLPLVCMSSAYLHSIRTDKVSEC